MPLVFGVIPAQAGIHFSCNKMDARLRGHDALDSAALESRMPFSMLKRLSIDQFVIISHLRLDLQAGLTVMTGETGAGKSILLDAMGLILGDEPDIEAIRAGANESTFQAVFAVKPTHPVWAYLADKNIKADPADDLTVDRVIGRDGRRVGFAGSATIRCSCRLGMTAHSAKSTLTKSTQ